MLTLKYNHTVIDPGFELRHFAPGPNHPRVITSLHGKGAHDPE